MTNLAILLTVAQFFTAASQGPPQQLLGLFNIFSPTSSPGTLARALNSLIGPIRKPGTPDIELNARASLILDLDSNRTLYQRNADDHLPIASITKIMTALVVLDNYGGKLDTIVTVPAASLAVTGSKMGLEAGERISVRNLLSGMLIESANDAAMALAHIVSGGQEKFVGLMNDRAVIMRLDDTHFANPVGFDAPGHYATAWDIAQLTKAALQDETFAGIVKTAKLTVKDASGKTTHNLVTTNKLLGQYTNVTGVKTGTTTEAGESLVASVVGDSGQKIVVVLLASPNRFDEGRRALDWALTSYAWIESL